MTCTRPGISRMVSQLSQTLATPKAENLVAAKHVLWYLKGTYDYELCFTKRDEDLKGIAFSNLDLASSVEYRRSTTGYCFSLTKQSPANSWKSKTQNIGIINAWSRIHRHGKHFSCTTHVGKHVLTHLLNGMDNNIYSCTKIHGDNQGDIAPWLQESSAQTEV